MSSSYSPRVIGSMVLILLAVLGTTQVWAAEDATPAAATTVISNSLELGWGNLDVDGNRSRYEQYVTPPTGFFLSEWSGRRWDSNGRALVDLRLRDPWQPSANGDLWISLGRGAVVARAAQRHSSFFPDWQEPGSGRVSRRDAKYDLAAPLGRGELRASYRGSKVAPSGGADGAWRNGFSGLSYAGHAGNWQGGLDYQNERFSFGEGASLSGSAATTTLRLIPPTGDSTFLEGTAAMTRTSLDGRTRAPRYYRLALQGGHEVSSDLSLLADLSNYRVSRPIAETAYAQGASNAQLLAEYRGIRRTTVSVGTGVREVDYLNQQQNENTSTRVRNFQAKAVTRFNRAFKLKVSQARWWIDRRPTAFGLAGDPEGALVWSTKTDQRAELTYASGGSTGVTASWHGVKWDNSDTGTRNSIIDRSVYGWWIPQERCTIYGTATEQDFGLVGAFPGSNFVTNARAWTAGGTYQFDPATAADLSFTRSVSRGDLGADERIWAAGVSHRLPCGDRLSARVAVDDFETSQATPTVDFDATRLEVRYTKVAF